MKSGIARRLTQPMAIPQITDISSQLAYIRVGSFDGNVRLRISIYIDSFDTLRRYSSKLSVKELCYKLVNY